jgi:hypothetical protein
MSALPSNHASTRDWISWFEGSDEVLKQVRRARIAADVELNYQDKIISSSGEILSETVIPSLKVKYIIGKNKKNWLIVDYISGN